MEENSLCGGCLREMVSSKFVLLFVSFCFVSLYLKRNNIFLYFYTLEKKAAQKCKISKTEQETARAVYVSAKMIESRKSVERLAWRNNFGRSLS